MKKEGRYSWTIKITIISFFLSTFISVITNLMLENVGLALAFLVLGVVVSIGIVFDIIGMSVTSTHEAPFHSMSTRGVKGSREAIVLIRIILTIIIFTSCHILTIIEAIAVTRPPEIIPTISPITSLQKFDTFSAFLISTIASRLPFTPRVLIE